MDILGNASSSCSVTPGIEVSTGEDIFFTRTSRKGNSLKSPSETSIPTEAYQAQGVILHQSDAGGV